MKSVLTSTLAIGIAMGLGLCANAQTSNTVPANNGKNPPKAVNVPAQNVSKPKENAAAKPTPKTPQKAKPTSNQQAKYASVKRGMKGDELTKLEAAKIKKQHQSHPNMSAVNFKKQLPRNITPEEKAALSNPFKAAGQKNLQASKQKALRKPGTPAPKPATSMSKPIGAWTTKPAQNVKPASQTVPPKN